MRLCPTHTPEHPRTNLKLPKTSEMSDMIWRVVKIGDFLTSIGVQYTNEPQLFRHYDSNTKSDRVYHLPGQPKVVDMTIQSPTRTVRLASKTTHPSPCRLHTLKQTTNYDALSTVLNFKLPQSLRAHDVNSQIPKDIFLFTRNLHLHRSIFIPHPETNTQPVQKFPLSGLPNDLANCRALAFLHSLVLRLRPPILSPNNQVERMVTCLQASYEQDTSTVLPPDSYAAYTADFLSIN
jgi:hypothetical protein